MPLSITTGVITARGFGFSSGGKPFTDTQTFNTAGTWTKPSGAITSIQVLVIGGGGGGGTTNNNPGGVGAAGGAGFVALLTENQFLKPRCCSCHYDLGFRACWAMRPV